MPEGEREERRWNERERRTRANDSKTMQLFAITASVRGSRNYPILFPLLVPLPALSSPLQPPAEFVLYPLTFSLSLSLSLCLCL